MDLIDYARLGMKENYRMDVGLVGRALTAVIPVIMTGVINANIVHFLDSGLERLRCNVSVMRATSHGMVSVWGVSLVNTKKLFQMSPAHNVGHFRLRLFQGVEWQQAVSNASVNPDTLHPPAAQTRYVLPVLVENTKSLHLVASHARTALWVEQQSRLEVHSIWIV